MTLTVYESGSLVTTSASFVNEAGAAADPTTVVLNYKLDAASTVSVTYPTSPVIKDAVGAYHADLDTTGFTGPGLQKWFVEWVGSGAVTAIQNDAWLVQPKLL